MLKINALHLLLFLMCCSYFCKICECTESITVLVKRIRRNWTIIIKFPNELSAIIRSEDKGQRYDLHNMLMNSLIIEIRFCFSCRKNRRRPQHNNCRTYLKIKTTIWFLLDSLLYVHVLFWSVLVCNDSSSFWDHEVKFTFSLPDRGQKIKAVVQTDRCAQDFSNI